MNLIWGKSEFNTENRVNCSSVNTGATGSSMVELRGGSVLGRTGTR